MRRTFKISTKRLGFIKTCDKKNRLLFWMVYNIILLFVWFFLIENTELMERIHKPSQIMRHPIYNLYLHVEVLYARINSLKRL